MSKTFVTLIVLVLIVILGGIFLLDREEAAPDTAMTDETEMVMEEESDMSVAEGKYTLSEESTVEWNASKTFLDYTDQGNVSLSGGTLSSDGETASGTITADMTTIVATETPGPFGVDRLTTHLKSDDFFAVETYPEAELVVTNIANGKMIGELTIKGITQGFSTPVEVTENEGVLTLSGTAVIDRTLFDVRYGSDSFFDNLGDNTIDDEFMLDFDLVFNLEVMEDGTMMEAEA